MPAVLSDGQKQDHLIYSMLHNLWKVLFTPFWVKFPAIEKYLMKNLLELSKKKHEAVRTCLEQQESQVKACPLSL